mgnify:FL=1
MKKTLIYILMVAAVILTACGGGQATEAPAGTEAPGAREAPAGGETTERCGDQAPLAEEIFHYTWGE